LKPEFNIYYITHEGIVTKFYPAAGDSLRFTAKYGELASNTPEGAGGEFGPTWRENQQK
jgi:hypothetical protein